MANLFSLPTPAEVREDVNRRMFRQLPYYNRGRLGQANMGAAAIGMGLGRMFGGQGAGEKRAGNIQDIMQATRTEYGDFDVNDPQAIGAFGQRLAGNLIKGGQQEAGMKVYSQIQAMQPTEADVAAKDVGYKQLNVHRGKIDKFSGDMRKIDAAYTKIKKNAEERTASGDMGIVFGIMKLLDPNSTVREGEYATAKNAAGVPERIMNLYNNAKDGQLMQEGQRQKFLATSDNLYAGQRESTDRSIENVLQQADQDAIGREKVMGTKRLKAYQERRKPPTKEKQQVIEVDW